MQVLPSRLATALHSSNRIEGVAPRAGVLVAAVGSAPGATAATPGKLPCFAGDLLHRRSGGCPGEHASAYTLVFGGFLLLGGRLGDVFGRRRMFIAGLVIFTLASFAGGLATTSGWLITTHAFQGLGGAITAPTALALIGETFPDGAP